MRSAVSAPTCRALFNQFDRFDPSHSAILPRVTQPIPSSNSLRQLTRAEAAEPGRFTLIWFLVLLIAILAIAGGLALSKFLFILLVVAVIVALLGARSAA